MLMKIRELVAKSNANNPKLSGEVEIDETFIGGKTKTGIKIRKWRNVKDVVIRIKFLYSECLKEAGR